MKLAIHCQHVGGNLQHNGVDVKTRHCVGSIVVRVVCISCGGQHTSHAHAEVQRVKGCPQVDVERVIDRSCEYAYAVAQVINSLFEQILVVRHRLWADVGRH